jgi:phosphoenolpyruvate-protein kinase (PTS system EI component)
MGTAWLAGDGPEWRHAVRQIEQHEVEAELRRIEVAFDRTRAELRESARRVEEQFSAELGQIFRAHEMLLEGILSSQELARELHASLVDAEAAVQRVFRRWHEKFQSLQGESFQQRADDIADIGRKVLRHLAGKDTDRWKTVPAGSVLVLRRLLPSDVVSLSQRDVAAIVVESPLGHGSHAALLAREKRIPTVANFSGLL